jgi:hypothetical protein
MGFRIKSALVMAFGLVVSGLVNAKVMEQVCRIDLTDVHAVEFFGHYDLDSGLIKSCNPGDVLSVWHNQSHYKNALAIMAQFCDFKHEIVRTENWQMCRYVGYKRPLERVALKPKKSIRYKDNYGVPPGD